MMVSARVLEDVWAHAREVAPRECCGVLIGVTDRIMESVRARNLDEHPNRFQLDPRDHIAALRSARARHLDVVGFYHSHPHSPAYPSETDIAECGYAAALHLIVGRGVGGDEARLFTIERERVTEFLLEPEADGAC